MLIIQDNNVRGNTAPNIYHQMKPWQHLSGAYRWVVDNEQGTVVFVDSDGTEYRLRQRFDRQLEQEQLARQYTRESDEGLLDVQYFTERFQQETLR